MSPTASSALSRATSGRPSEKSSARQGRFDGLGFRIEGLEFRVQGLDYYD